MLRSGILLSLLFLNNFCFSQDAATLLRVKYFTEKAQNYLDKEKALSGFYSIDKDGITMYASAINKANHKDEFFIGWNNLVHFNDQIKRCIPGIAFETYKSGKYGAVVSCMIPEKIVDRVYTPEKKPLEGLKIALDPGHIAYDFEMGDLEKKHIKMKADTARGLNDSVEIAEGMLTYATAQLLKTKLEKEGAEVLLTRKDGNSAFGKTYGQWKKEDLAKAVDSLAKTGELKAGQKKYFLSEKAKDRDIFRVIFRDLELAKRVELINKYKPAFTVIIHYNVDETNKEWDKPSGRNMNMAFVGGAFMKNDLSDMEKRIEFLRLLISDDIEKSVSLREAVVSAFEKKLDVPTATIRSAKYLIEGCLPTGINGVYCRNLQLPRYIHTPLVYGETLFQDNIGEVQLLNKEADKTKNERVQRVAEAYFQGILDYVNKKTE